LLFVLIWLLEKLTNKGGSLAAVFAVVAGPAPTPEQNKLFQKINSKPLVVAILLLMGAGVVAQFLDQRTESYPEHRSFVNYPLQIVDWKGKHEKLDVAVVEKLGMTDYLLANYRNEQGSLVNFYVAYYQSQRKGVSPHSPRVCIPGGGWEIAQFERIEANGHPVNRVLIKKGNQRQLVYYWFQGHGRLVANEYINKWYLFIDSIFKNRTDGALVRYTIAVAQHEDISVAEAKVLSFMAESESQLNDYIVD